VRYGRHAVAGHTTAMGGGAAAPVPRPPAGGGDAAAAPLRMMRPLSAGVQCGRRSLSRLSRLHGHIRAAAAGTPASSSIRSSCLTVVADAASPVLPPEERLRELLRPEVLLGFDRAKFERDGFWVWPAALTDSGRERMTKTLQLLQSRQDYMVMHTDWTFIDWAGRDLPPPPPERLTREWRETRVCGGSEQLSYYPASGGRPEVGKGFLNMPTRTFMAETGLFGVGTDALATDGSWSSQGHAPEFTPLCHSPFLLDLATAHPQMMQMFSSLFAGGRFCLDHAALLNRKHGEGAGRHWHAHRYSDGRYEEHDEDADGTPNPHFMTQQCIRTLCYPEGAVSAEDGGYGGELGLIPVRVTVSSLHVTTNFYTAPTNAAMLRCVMYASDRNWMGNTLTLR
jgi:hypothetical protein